VDQLHGYLKHNVDYPIIIRIIMIIIRMRQKVKFTYFINCFLDIIAYFIIAKEYDLW